MRLHGFKCKVSQTFTIFLISPLIFALFALFTPIIGSPVTVVTCKVCIVGCFYSMSTHTTHTCDYKASNGKYVSKFSIFHFSPPMFNLSALFFTIIGLLIICVTYKLCIAGCFALFLQLLLTNKVRALQANI